MKRSKFSLSHYRLYTSDMGELVPTSVIEVLPGDTVQQATSLLLRCSPMLAPVMHPCHVRIHCWYVPLRLIWDDFEDFITGGPDGNDDTVFPTISLTNVSTGSLADYLGVPPSFTGAVSALPFRAYNLIWNEHYRDQDLQAELVISNASGPDTTTSTALQNVNWEKDYFTSSRPWEQKGPAITIPIGTEAPVRTKSSDVVTGVQTPVRMRDTSSGAYPGAFVGTGVGSSGGLLSGSGVTQGAASFYPANLYGDLSNASAVTVNALREALALQRYEEARARYGSRYVEYLRYLGVRSSDARLQRPEYLGGGRQTVQFSEVLQSSPTTTPAGVVGDMKGHGISAMRSNRYRRFFEEHGYMLCFVSILPKTMYMQGLGRHWNRRTKDDYWQREFQHIGQQEVLNKEVYAVTGQSDPDGTFGFQDRYDEYRRHENSVAGDFRGTLAFWHFARDFATPPALNASFVKAVPTERPFAVPSQDILWVMARHSIQARRMIARTGTSFIF